MCIGGKKGVESERISIGKNSMYEANLSATLSFRYNHKIVECKPFTVIKFMRE